MTTYTGSYMGKTYSVDVADNGAIHVQPGDWLSKYSVAIYKDPAKVYDIYGREDKKGVINPITNVNLIFAGETVYHLPTLEGYLDRQEKKPIRKIKAETMVLVGEPVGLGDPDEYEDKSLESFITLNFQLPGEHGKFFATVCKILKLREVAFVLKVGELIGINKFFDEALKTGGEANQILTIIKVVLAIANSMETLEGIWAARAIAYTATAWAFGHHPLPPEPSKGLIARLSSPGTLGTGDRKATLASCMNAWEVTARATWSELENTYAKEFGETTMDAVIESDFNGFVVSQAFIRAIGKDNPALTCERLMRALEKLFGEKRELLTAFRATYEIKYPD